MSISRKELISQYDIKEQELQDLLDALCNKPEDANNIGIIRRALRGDYSDFGSSHAMPQHLMVEHFKQASYNDLIQRVYDGDFDYNYGAKPSAKNPNFEAAATNVARQENSMFALVNVLSKKPNITIGEFATEARAEEAKLNSNMK
jgi:hypothetical protein